MCRGAAELERLCGERTEAPLPAAVVLERASETPFIELRPQTIAEIEFRKRAFPEQKVAEPALVSSANQQIDLACGIQAMIDFVQQAVKVRDGESRTGLCAVCGVHDAVLRRVIDGNAQQHSGTRRARTLALLDGSKQVLAEPIAAADHIEA